MATIAAPMALFFSQCNEGTIPSLLSCFNKQVEISLFLPAREIFNQLRSVGQISCVNDVEFYRQGHKVVLFEQNLEFYLAHFWKASLISSVFLISLLAPICGERTSRSPLIRGARHWRCQPSGTRRGWVAVGRGQGDPSNDGTGRARWVRTTLPPSPYVPTKHHFSVLGILPPLSQSFSWF